MQKFKSQKFWLIFFLEPKTSQKSNFLGKKSPNDAFFKKGGWLVGWAWWATFRHVCQEKFFRVPRGSRIWFVLCPWTRNFERTFYFTWWLDHVFFTITFTTGRCHFLSQVDVFCGKRVVRLVDPVDQKLELFEFCEFFANNLNNSNWWYYILNSNFSKFWEP